MSPQCKFCDHILKLEQPAHSEINDDEHIFRHTIKGDFYFIIHRHTAENARQLIDGKQTNKSR